MGLQQMKWSKVKSLASHTGLPLVAAAVGSSGRVATCVTVDGAVWLVDRRTFDVHPHDGGTTTSCYVADRSYDLLSPEWQQEVDRRIAEVTARKAE